MCRLSFQRMTLKNTCQENLHIVALLKPLHHDRPRRKKKRNMWLKQLFPLGFEPRTSCVWGEHNNHYSLLNNSVTQIIVAGCLSLACLADLRSKIEFSICPPELTNCEFRCCIEAHGPGSLDHSPEGFRYASGRTESGHCPVVAAYSYIPHWVQQFSKGMVSVAYFMPEPY